MTSRICDELGDAELNVTAAFLADYAALLSGCGATCIRIERNTRRMAESFGTAFDIVIMPNHVTVTVWNDAPEHACIAVRRIAGCGTVADNSLDIAEAIERFEAIRLTKPTSGREVLLLTSAANASFCRLFGGDWAAMLIVFLTTLAGYRLKQIMLEDGRDIRLTFFCASLFSAALSAGGQIFGIGATPGIALATSVLYLIPGVPYINSVSDMLYRHYLCGFGRFMDAAVLTVCLSAGLCAGMLIVGLKWF